MKDDLKSICLSWEKLRIAYNVVLIIVTLGTLFLVGSGQLHGGLNGLLYYVFALPVLAIIANLLFCAGPAAEIYLYLLDWNFPPLRWLIFIAGTGLAALLAFLQVIFSSYDAF